MDDFDFKLVSIWVVCWVSAALAFSEAFAWAYARWYGLSDSPTVESQLLICQRRDEALVLSFLMLLIFWVCGLFYRHLRVTCHKLPHLSLDLTQSDPTIQDGYLRYSSFSVIRRLVPRAKFEMKWAEGFAACVIKNQHLDIDQHQTKSEHHPVRSQNTPGSSLQQRLPPPLESQMEVVEEVYRGQEVNRRESAKISSHRFKQDRDYLQEEIRREPSTAMLESKLASTEADLAESQKCAKEWADNARVWKQKCQASVATLFARTSISQCYLCIKPLLSHEATPPAIQYEVFQDKSQSNVFELTSHGQGVIGEKKITDRYHFDGIFEPSRQENHVWETFEPMFDCLLGGHNLLFIADGHSGSGKSFLTCTGPGAIGPLACDYLRDWLLKGSQEGTSRSLMLTVVEIDREGLNKSAIRDLISGTRSVSKKPADGILPLKFGPKQADSLPKVFKEAIRERRSSPTAKNKQSSRTHLICRFYLSEKIGENDEDMNSQLLIVDLAGNERHEDSAPHLQSPTQKVRGSINGEADSTKRELDSSFIRTSRWNLISTLERFVKSGTIDRSFDDVLVRAVSDCFVSHKFKLIWLAHITQLQTDLDNSTVTLKQARDVCKIDMKRGPPSRKS